MMYVTRSMRAPVGAGINGIAGMDWGGVANRINLGVGWLEHSANGLRFIPNTGNRAGGILASIIEKGAIQGLYGGIMGATPGTAG